MTKLITVLSFFFAAYTLYGQNPMKIPMTAEAWEFPSESATFIQHKGVTAVKILSDTSK